MSTRHTTVEQLTADDLGKRVEGEEWAIEGLNYIGHYDYNSGRPGADLFGAGSNGFQRVSFGTPCTVSDPPTPEPLDPAYRHVDKSGTEWARIDDIWVSPDHHPLSWEDLLDQRGTRGDS